MPSPSFAIVQPYDELEPPVWHVDLFRIEELGELDELGLDSAAEGVLLVEWPEKAGASGLAASAWTYPGICRRRREALDSQGPAFMAVAMASKMIPPDHAPAFLASCGWEGAEILPLAGDASFRRYFRVVHGDRSAVLMDAPPQHEDVRPFVAVAEWLAEAGLTAPEILARDMERGLLLLGDFGDWRLREFLDDDPSRERELYELATDVLVHLHQHEPMPGLPPHGLDQWLEELKLFTEWYCPAVGLSVDARWLSGRLDGGPASRSRRMGWDR